MMEGEFKSSSPSIVGNHSAIQSLLLIQTAFIGDVILATALVEALAAQYPDAKIDFLLRKGNESLLHNNPHIRKVLIWNKKERKYANLWQLLQTIRANKYDAVINLQRFANSGFLTAFSGAKLRIGFAKNPFSFLFTAAITHTIGDGTHEVTRNLRLLQPLSSSVGDLPSSIQKPRLYPQVADFQSVATSTAYICLAPTSVWFTKQWPAEKWIDLINKLPKDHAIYLLGGPPDRTACSHIANKAKHPNLLNKAGELSFLQSAALMANAKMNYVNDSAPLHIASAMNAPVTAIFCSTVPSFGFYPLSDQTLIAETQLDLDCRPCGLHGQKNCPKGHFKCSEIVVK